jgi:hypothetical protein
MRLPAAVKTSTPIWLFPEMTLRAAGVAPPTVLLGTPSISTPRKFPLAALPVASVPRKLPAMTTPPGLAGPSSGLVMRMAFPVKSDSPPAKP